MALLTCHAPLSSSLLYSCVRHRVPTRNRSAYLMGMLARYRSNQFVDAFVEPLEEEEEGKEGEKKKKPKRIENDNICFAFQKGRCARGARCIFTHELNSHAGYGLADKRKQRLTSSDDRNAKRTKPSEDDGPVPGGLGSGYRAAMHGGRGGGE